MKKKIFVTFLCFMILSFSVIQPKQAKAIAGVDDVVILSYIAAAAIAAGAVGTVVANSDGTYSGTLHNYANTTLLNMSPEMKLNLSMALMGARAAGYMALNKVTGLWDYLHTGYVTGTTPVPVTTSISDPASFFSPQCTVKFVRNSYSEFVVTYTSDPTYDVFQVIFMYDMYNLNLSSTNNIAGYNATLASALTDYAKQFIINKWAIKGLAIGSSFYLNDQSWTGSFPIYVPQTGIGTVVDDGTPSRDIAIPQSYPDLNNRTKDIPYPTTNTGGISLPAAPTADQVKTADTAADLTSAPSSTSDWTSTIGKAITTVLVGTGATTLNFEPLKMSGALFTTRFPFSIPWDIQNAIVGLGSGSATAPKWKVNFPASPWTQAYSIDIDLATFDSVMPALRAGELFLFTMGLAMATRRILGGAA